MTVLRIMWRRHGIGSRVRQAERAFLLGYHSAYHGEILGELQPCDERCANILG